MAITDEITIRYTNEVIRPMAEKIRAMKAEIDSHMLQWRGRQSLRLLEPARSPFQQASTQRQALPMSKDTLHLGRHTTQRAKL